MPTPAKKAVFIDRDGVLNVDLGYTYKPQDLKLVNGSIDGLKSLKDAGYTLVVITNQSGVARGFFSLDDVQSFNAELIRQIRQHLPQFSFDAMMICPHHPEGSVPEFSIECQCRKPGTALIMEAVNKLGIDLNKSWLVGDKDSDIECAINAGLRGIQVTRGGKQYPQSKQAFATLPTLREAAEVILKNSF